MALATLLATNSLLGPLGLNRIDYPFSETLVNQTIGLEAVTLGLVVPWAIVAAILVHRNHRAGPILAIPPSAYAAYMFVQYVLGPEYVVYRPIVAFHLVIFVLSGGLLVLAWSRIDAARLPALSSTRRRRIAGGVVLLAVFVSVRYLSAVQGVLTGAELTPEYRADPTMYWSIVLLDLGVVVPIAIATAVGLLRGAGWADRAVYGVVGWYVLVPISVVAMGVAMLLNGDPYASQTQIVVLSVAAVLFTAFAGWVYRPLVGRSAPR